MKVGIKKVFALTGVVLGAGLFAAGIAGVVMPVAYLILRLCFGVLAYVGMLKTGMSIIPLDTLLIFTSPFVAATVFGYLLLKPSWRMYKKCTEVEVFSR
jgi:hypothetical protein